MRDHRYTAVALAVSAITPALADGQTTQQDTRWCTTGSPSSYVRAIERAIADGLVHDHALAPAIPATPRITFPASSTRGAPCLAPEQIYLYEDTNALLVSAYSSGELFAFMVQAANQLIAEWGDNYDFIGFWMDFTPTDQLGSAAFYLPVMNDVTGIGFPDSDLPDMMTFDNHDALGLAGDNVDGLVMMWNVNDALWTIPGATRAIMGHEFGHRWACFLPPTSDGIEFQGDNTECYAVSHWNSRVDAQASVLGISEWIGSDPAVLTPQFFNYINFNTEIPNPPTGGGLWSYPELYLMGYVSPAEMDSLTQEFRYMVDAVCDPATPHAGAIRALSSADIIAAAGPRAPTSTDPESQKHFRAAWIMVHQPGSPPSPNDLALATEFLEQNTTDWGPSTLSRGSINHALFYDPDCDGVPDPLGCNPADLAEPFGALDFSDVLAFLTAFGAADPLADLAPPTGVFDFSDVLAFLTGFGAGCP